MTTEISPETEELLRQARSAPPMPSTHRRRLKGALLTRIAFMSASALAVGHAAAATTIAAKAVVGLVVVASVGTGGYLAVRAARQPSPSLPAPVTEPVRQPGPPPGAAETAGTEPEVAPLAAPSTSAPGLPPRRSSERRRSPTGPVALAQETALLRGADRALRAGDTATAMALLNRHAARFPQGTLVPEREAGRLIVRCQNGDAGEAAAARYLADHPGSPLADRVRRACAANRR